MNRPAWTRTPTRRSRDAAPERYATIRRVTLVGAGMDLLLAVGKTASGLLAQSQSLVADGVHSISDLVAESAAVIALDETVEAARKGIRAARASRGKTTSTALISVHESIYRAACE